MTTSTLPEIARQTYKNMEQLRTLLPGLPDEQILNVVKALSNGAAQPEVPPDAPPTLAAAIVEILKVSGQASRGEITRAIINKGYHTVLAADRELYGTIGRVLARPPFEKIHRGMYRITTRTKPAAAAPEPAPTALGLTKTERKALSAAKKLSQPFLAHELAAALNVNVFQVVPRLKVLRQQGLIKQSEVQASGTAKWVVT